MARRSLEHEADQYTDPWWREAVIYQIYPRSFLDASGDGAGDLVGITEKLDYLSWLGVDAIWLSPIYPSPMADFGYDVSDYTDIHPLFGTLSDFDRLLSQAHRLGLKVMLDFVPNHTSDEHPWFVASRSSRESPKRDWYIWRDSTPGGLPPNNWEIYLPLERLLLYYGDDLKCVHLPFNFQLVTMEGWDAQTVRKLVDDYEAALPEGAWPNWVLGNHDVPRIATRVGAEGARLAAMLLLTLRGTPTLYYGDEIGTENVPVPPEMARDPQGRLFPGYGRDPVRTPMRWDTSPNAGFCRKGSAPWLPVGGDVERVNVEAQRDDPGSMLSLTRRLISLRQTTQALRSGSYEPAVGVPEGCFAFSRRLNEQEIFVALNFSAGEAEVPLPGAADDRPWRVLLSTRGEDREGRELCRAARMSGHEGLLLISDHS